uniref:Uncharacterized protein n=1 Tax=Suricata suricatta TaxID=37032 RepID=A0A673TEH4_SURSU
MHVEEKAGGPASGAIIYPSGTALTPLRSYPSLSRSLSLKWETPKWYMAGTVASNTRRCLCWISRRDLIPVPSSSEPWGLACPAPTTRCFPLPLAHSQALPAGAGARFLLPPVTSSTPFLSPCVASSLHLHALPARPLVPCGPGNHHPLVGRHSCYCLPS